MKTSTAVILAGIAVAIAFGPRFLHAARSAQPVSASSTTGDGGFDRKESAALFVGVRRFTHRELVQVRYAADDAVDLAYLFVFDRRIRLVPADRVIIALSGRPEKPESQLRLEQLQHAGAILRHADQTDIALLLRRQAALAGKNGILIVSLATHGFVRDGVPYILGASSVVQYPATTVSVASILDTTARSRAARSLVFIDACRERLSPPTRSVTRQTETAAPLLRRMGHTHGQAIFFAAAAGGFAYDDDGSRNGVFTKAVIDGLNCHAAKPRGNVTAYTLGTYVQNSVLKWIHQNVDSSIRSAIQLDIDGDARNMPLSQCWVTTCSDPAVCLIARVTTKGTTVVALKSDGTEAWRHEAGERIRRAVVADIDADGDNEVVLATKFAV
ncbi:MAG TPA: caspase family protein [Thermoanaerobaculia bacterium]